MKKALVFFGVVLLFGCSPASIIKLDRPPEAKYESSQIEPSIAINPNNVDQIIAGSVLNDFYYTNDGGKSWRLGRSRFNV